MRIAVALVSALALAAMAPPGSAGPDKGRIAAAGRLLDAMHFEETMDRTVDALIAEQKRAFPQQLERILGTAPPAELVAKVQQAVETHIRVAFARNRAKNREGTALIYAKHFTAAELDRLARFQSDPVMAKMRAELPTITAESMALAMAGVQSSEGEMRRDIEKIVKDYLESRGKPPSS